MNTPGFLDSSLTLLSKGGRKKVLGRVGKQRQTGMNVPPFLPTLHLVSQHGGRESFKNIILPPMLQKFFKKE